MSARELLPITKTLEPTDPAAVAECVRQAYDSATPVYPIGGATSLDYGLPAKLPGLGLSLAGCRRVVDYPARDMTITVEAGITIAELARTLAVEKQQCPFDVPAPELATLGGVVATNANGPRRYGLGAVRDFVIGIQAVDGRGVEFHGGGRVVKNVAGYDFCKLLTGSLGTLGVVTQLTLKLKPLPERSTFVACSVADLDEAERLLAALGRSTVAPAAIELLAGAEWDREPALAAGRRDAASDRSLHLVVGLEGTAVETTWMERQLASEWTALGVPHSWTVTDDAATALWRRLAEFPAAGVATGPAEVATAVAAPAALTLKASVVPSGVTRIIAALREVDRRCSIQAHAGNGAVVARFAEFPVGGLSRTLLGKLQPAARAAGGHLTILSNPSGAEMTHQSVWGGDGPFALMTSVKRQFDPKNLLNPGRFVYTS